MFFLPDIQSILANIQAAFTLVFPEFPAVGIVVCGLSLFLFGFYLVKAGIKQALKITLVTFAIMLFTLFSVHSLYRIVSV
jgi:hypothetical protein